MNILEYMAIFIFSLASAQFPAVCVQNATLPNATCCPIPPGFTEPCGGPQRGICIHVSPIDDLQSVPEVSRQDDRFNWPTRFFENVCSCIGNYHGYMCNECWYGYTGPECNKKIKTVRKDIKTLTSKEKEHFVSVLNESMYVPSDYMVLNTTHETTDPAVNPKFVGVSVYQYLSYLHYYSSRKTIFNNDSLCNDPESLHPDMAHEGPAFPPWHRLYALKWERALQKIAGDETFALPYWDWTDDGSECEVCTNDLLGASNSSDPFGGLSSDSVFSNWGTMCQQPETGCDICDPYLDAGPIIRRPGGDPRFPTLPTRDATNYALSLTVYDDPPFSRNSLSFRNVLEGFVNANSSTAGTTDVHNLVHRYLNGTMSSTTRSAMDPIFIIHHTFVDKLFEIWIRRTKSTDQALPLEGAFPGHNRYSYLVPFFPLESVYEFYKTSDYMGYDYDDMPMESPKHEENAETIEKKNMLIYWREKLKKAPPAVFGNSQPGNKEDLGGARVNTTQLKTNSRRS